MNLQADAAGIWAFTAPSFSTLMGGIEPAYLKLIDGTLEATIRTAARDLRRVGRNLDLIDQEALAEVVAEEGSLDEQQGERS